MTAFEKHEFIKIPFNDLIDGHITWKDYINSLSPEDLAKQRAYDRNRVKKWYDQNRERRKEYFKQRVVCECGKEVNRGYLSSHRKHQYIKKKLKRKTNPDITQRILSCFCKFWNLGNIFQNLVCNLNS